MNPACSLVPALSVSAEVTTDRSVMILVAIAIKLCEHGMQDGVFLSIGTCLFGGRDGRTGERKSH